MAALKRIWKHAGIGRWFVLIFHHCGWILALVFRSCGWIFVCRKKNLPTSDPLGFSHRTLFCLASEAFTIISFTIVDGVSIFTFFPIHVFWLYFGFVSEPFTIFFFRRCGWIFVSTSISFLVSLFYFGSYGIGNFYLFSSAVAAAKTLTSPI